MGSRPLVKGRSDAASCRFNACVAGLPAHFCYARSPPHRGEFRVSGSKSDFTFLSRLKSSLIFFDRPECCVY